MGEHFIPDRLLRSLAHPDHQEIIQEGGKHADKINTGQHTQKPQQGGVIGINLSQHGGDVIVHQGTQGGRTYRLGNGAENNADHDHCHGGLVLGHIGQQPGNGLLRIFGLTAISFHFYRRHYWSPPFC